MLVATKKRCTILLLVSIVLLSGGGNFSNAKDKLFLSISDEMVSLGTTPYEAVINQMWNKCTESECIGDSHPFSIRFYRTQCWGLGGDEDSCCHDGGWEDRDCSITVSGQYDDGWEWRNKLVNILAGLLKKKTAATTNTLTYPGISTCGVDGMLRNVSFDSWQCVQQYFYGCFSLSESKIHYTIPKYIGVVYHQASGGGKRHNLNVKIDCNKGPSRSGSCEAAKISLQAGLSLIPEIGWAAALGVGLGVNCK